MCTMPVDPGCSSEWAVMWMEDTDDGGVFSRPKEIGGVCGSAGVQLLWTHQVHDGKWQGEGNHKCHK
jgi:hypothetical protein